MIQVLACFVFLQHYEPLMPASSALMSDKGVENPQSQANVYLSYMGGAKSAKVSAQM